MSFLSPVSLSPSSFSCANTTTTISNGCPDPLSQLVNILTASPVQPPSNINIHNSTQFASNSCPTSLNIQDRVQSASNSCPTSLNIQDRVQFASNSCPSSLNIQDRVQHVSNSCPSSLTQVSPSHVSTSPTTELNFLGPATSSSAQQFSSPNIHISSEVIPSFHFWRRKDHPSIREFEVDPTGLQHVLSFLVNKIDVLTAKNEELQSKSDIMQNSLFTTLNSSIEEKFNSFREEYKSKLDLLSIDSTIEQCADICKNLETEVDKKIQGVLDDNEEMRRVWDTHMEGIRTRIHRNSLSSEDEDDEDEYGMNDLGNRTVVPDAPVNPRPHDAEIKVLTKEIEQLKKLNHKLDIRLVQVEQYSRRESMVFSGVPAVIPQESLQKVMLAVMMCLGFQDLTYDDITACHRLWSPHDSREPAKVIIKFTNRKIVEWALAHPENLSHVKETLGLELTMSESLCAANAESQQVCKWLKDNGHIHHFYSRNGFSKVVLENGSFPVKITHPDHLRKKFANLEIPSFDK